MSRKSIVVSKVSEGHDNPIAELVQVACRFDSEITLESDNRRINAKSIMGIMAFNPSDGMSVDIITKGIGKRRRRFGAVGETPRRDRPLRRFGGGKDRVRARVHPRVDKRGRGRSQPDVHFGSNIRRAGRIDDLAF